jgi:hypothetical protein
MTPAGVGRFTDPTPGILMLGHSPKGSTPSTGSSAVYAYGCAVSSTSGSTLTNCPVDGS